MTETFYENVHHLCLSVLCSVKQQSHIPLLSSKEWLGGNGHALANILSYLNHLFKLKLPGIPENCYFAIYLFRCYNKSHDMIILTRR